MSYIGNTLPANFQSLPAVQRFNGDGSDTTFTLAAQIANDQSILVSVDGVTQDSNAYSISGTTLTFTSAPSAGTGNIFVNTISPVGSTITHPASDPLSASTGTFSGALSATTGTFNGKITADAGIDIDNFNIDGTTIALSSGDITLDSAGDIILDADGEDIRFKDGGVQSFVFTMGGGSTIATPRGNLTLDVAGAITLDADGGDVVISDAGTQIAHLSNSNNDFKIESKVSDKDIIFRGNDGGSGITALTLDMSAAGLAIFNAGIALGGTGAANTLDDYEEGTWTPTDASGASMTLTVYEAFYTKIGRKVFIEFGGAIPSNSSTADIRIGGLPFTAKSGNDNTGGFALIGTNSGRTDLWLVSRGTTHFGAGTNNNVSAKNNNYSNNQIKLCGSYTVA